MLVCLKTTLNKEKFHFLLDNGCDFNIRSNDKMFPISVLIDLHMLDEVYLLIDKGANLNDETAIWEPIVRALVIEDQQLVEKLIYRGASAFNTQYPVLERYIKFGMMREIKDWNPLIGAQMQAAMRRDKINTARLIYDQGDDDTRIKLVIKIEKLKDKMADVASKFESSRDDYQHAIKYHTKCQRKLEINN